MPGEQRVLRLELRLLADVGLLGLPNVGKSTLLAAVSRARPRVANYPFTTLTPHLGVVELPGNRQFVMADIPGLVEGAGRGRGLGLRFLRHLERTSVLLHLVTVGPDPSSDPVEDWLALRAELEAYNPQLAKRPEVTALNKIDLPEVRERAQELEGRFFRLGVDLFGVSAATTEGVRKVLEAVWSTRESARGPAPR